MDTLAQLRAGQLAGIRRLDLSANLSEFPPEIYDLADSLEILNLSDNALSSLPDDLQRLHKLRIVFCSDNRFTRLPEVLGRCPNLSMIGFKANRIAEVPAAALPPSLRWLVLTDNQIEALPDSIGDCLPLQKLMLAGNRLQQLPATLANCRNLELLRIAANQLQGLPDCLLTLPKLAWLAYSGNPFSDRSEDSVLARHPIREIDWAGLSIKERLGEGASGEIFRATWQMAADRVEPVAVKVFKGAVTSDGLPHSEMDACIAAGTHANLIPVLGKVCGHPQGADALVMSLIPPHFTNLAGPPSLDSCTRDIYSPDTRLSRDVLLRIARGIASAAQHLHAEGVLHGDLYAHNILRNEAGDSLLGDFGAASFFEPENTALADALQAIEVRAFGCLLEELLPKCVELAFVEQESLRSLTERCLKSDSRLRPRFGELTKSLLVLGG
jgi:hypothetical protein